jgi:hypothetical protein
VRLSLTNCTYQLHPCTVLTAAHHKHTRPPDVLARIASPQSLSNTYSSLELRSSPSVWNCLEDHKTPPSTRTDSRSRLDWGVTTSLPATFFEGMLIREGTSSLYSGYFIPLSLWFTYSLYSHTFIVRICNHASALLVYLGGAYRESLGVHFSLS